MILLATGNVFAAQESKQNDALVTKQTEIAQTKTDKQTPSFWVRHADKLKKVSYGLDIAFPVFFVIACILQPLEEQNLKNLAYNILTITMITKWVLDPTIKSVMSKKHAFELEALQAKLDAAQQETKTKTA